MVPLKSSAVILLESSSNKLGTNSSDRLSLFLVQRIVSDELCEKWSVDENPRSTIRRTRRNDLITVPYSSKPH
jgi:hypothetical protein